MRYSDPMQTATLTGPDKAVAKPLVFLSSITISTARPRSRFARVKLEDLLTIQEIASKLGISSLTVRRRLRAKEIPLVRVGRLLRVPSRDAALLFKTEASADRNSTLSSLAKDDNELPQG